MTINSAGSVLEQLWLGDIKQRQPRYLVVIWNQRLSTVQEIVLNEDKGPKLDISKWVSSVDVSQNQPFENSEDAVSSQAEITIEIEKDVDVGGRRLDIDERLFADGTPIRIYEGDDRVYKSDWPAIFTGVCRGNPGSQIAVPQARRQVRIQAFGRAQSFQGQTIVGVNWPYDTDLGDMAVDVAMIEMGLEREEIRFGQFDFKTKHKANALVEIEKMTGLYEIMKHVGRRPYFNAYGLLVSHDTDFDKPPVYVFDNSDIVTSITRVQQLKGGRNSVQVIGLNSALTKVVNPSTDLREVNTTLGYFDTHYREDIYFSDDKTRRAEETGIRVVHKGGFGGGADWEQRSEFHGRLTIDTKYAPWVISFIILAWLVLSFWEYQLDKFIATGGDIVTLTGASSTRLIVQLLKMAAMVTLLIAMTKIGRFRIFVFGKPFEFVHEENRAIASLQDVNSADLDEVEISMPWMHNIDLSKEAAKQQLRREMAKGQQYQIEISSNSALEIDDIIVVRDQNRLPNENYWYFYVNSIGKSLRRNGTHLMTLTAWKIKEKSLVSNSATL